MNKQWKLTGSIFLAFLKMGPLTFGGGYALIPVIEREVVEKKEWLPPEEITDIMAIAGSVPGAVAANSATLIGYRIAGIRGALAALFGILFPAFCLMIALSVFYVQFKDNAKIQAAFTAIRATVAALIVYAAVRIGRTSVVDFATGAIAAVGLLLLFTRLHPMLVIVFGAVAGIAAVMLRDRFGKPTKPLDETPVYDYMI
ncbi:chromate transporter [Cohnella nanjingensis]|uniref:Chromate transporter n=1 Tax=Cohnella nanjingensis TaxID=1387779 RepID=A0A7X0RWX5_9BACL|nr:chromate transporter [Cohnella nanjingensis]MBB6675183.1 chromate transporter [Cohnella nanjingensis]